jgi:hypothetical protein
VFEGASYNQEGWGMPLLGVSNSRERILGSFEPNAARTAFVIFCFVFCAGEFAVVLFCYCVRLLIAEAETPPTPPTKKKK